MTLFVRVVGEERKGEALMAALAAVRTGEPHSAIHEAQPESFGDVPGAPLAYWVSDELRKVFGRLPSIECARRTAKQGLATADDLRFVRLWWEALIREIVSGNGLRQARWRLFARGGAYSAHHADVYLALDWGAGGSAIREFSRAFIRNEDNYFRPGLTWPLRTTSGLALRVLPAGCIFADKGPAAFVEGDDPTELLALLALTNSQPFRGLVELQLAAADAAARSYEVGVIQRTPVPDLEPADRDALSGLARRAWSLKRGLDTVELTSHAFVLPALPAVHGRRPRGTGRGCAGRAGGHPGRDRRALLRSLRVRAGGPQGRARAGRGTR